MNTCPALSADLLDVLRSSPLGQLRHLRVTENALEVVLTGRVSSYYLKQMAQETIRTAVGDRTLVNRVEVWSDEAA
ncbi:MAG: BON domain-containing protein [Gemmata sp.]|jgi:hypothetical protein